MSTKICKYEINCAVFDLDGTLLNTIKTITHYLNFALQKSGLSPVSEQECSGFVGDGVRMLILRAIEARGEYTDSLFARMLEDYNTAYDAEPHHLTEVYEGVGEMLRTLAESGVRLAVLSNKPHFATCATIERFFPDTFDVVLGGREGVPLKPNPTALIDAIASLGASPAQCAYIGDSDVDMLTARNAGVALSVGASWGYRSREVLIESGADCIADTASDLPRLIFTKNT